LVVGLLSPVFAIDIELVFESGILDDSNIDLDYYSIADRNGVRIDVNSLSLAVESGDLNILFDDIDYRDYNYSLNTEDYNYLDNLSLYFDMNDTKILLGSIRNHSIDYNITYFNIIDGVYYLVSDNNLFVYEMVDNNLSLLSEVDTNDFIYSVAKSDDNGNDYLFIANNGDGVGVYDITDSNINDISGHYVGAVIYNYGGSDYNTSYLSSLETSNGLKYIVATQINDFFSGVILYKVSDLVNLITTIGSNDRVVVMDTLESASNYFFDNDYNSISIPYFASGKTMKLVYNYNSNDVNIYSNSLKSVSYPLLSFMNSRIFSLTADSNGIASYDVNDFRNNFEISFSAKASINLGDRIFSLTTNQDLNEIYAQLSDRIAVFDYNFITDEFSLDRNILGISTPTTAECTSSIYNSSEKTLFVGQTENFTEIPDQPLTIFGTSYQVNYYLPATTLEALSLDTNQIDYNTYYDSNSFDGIITATFNIYDYNISKSYDLNEYYFNVYLDGNCDYNIEDSVFIDLNLCSREDNRTYLCNYDFNIIQLNDDLNIEYSTYQFTIDVNNANLISSVDFNFDLTPEEEVIEEEEQNSGGGGSHSNSNYGSGAPSLQVNNPSINYQDNIDLLEISYLQKIQLFDNYHIPFEIINFDLNQDSNNFINDYNEILEKYSNLPELRVIERILISGNISLDAIDLINSNGYEL